MSSFISIGLAEAASTEIPQATAVRATESVIAGWLTTPQAIAAIIAACVSLFAAWMTNRREKKELFSNIVSRERMMWVREVRKLSMELCAICECYDIETIVQQSDKLLAFYQARSGLLLHLSPWNKYSTDNELIKLLNPLDINPEQAGKDQINPLPKDHESVKLDYQQVQAHCQRIRVIMTEICKMEWDKVKIESGNNKKKQKEIDELQKTIRM